MISQRHRTAIGLIAVLGLSLATATPSEATKLMSQRFTCPIGGQGFEGYAYSSLTAYGRRPDGRPISTLGGGYLLYPECPRNRLVLYRDFSPAEITALKVLIKSPEYQRLLDTETQFYRVAWLEHALNPQSPDYVWHLLRATWYVDRDADKKARYRQAFLAVAEPIPTVASDTQSLMLRLRVLNVWRETGQFDRVLKGLSELPVDDLAQGLPEDEEAAWRLPEEELERWDFVRSARQLKTLALRQDTSLSPIDFLPEWMAAEACLYRLPKTEFETDFCAQPAMMELTVSEREAYAADPASFAQSRADYDYDGPVGAPPPPPKPMKTSPK